jgi:hypothetical protein
VRIGSRISQRLERAIETSNRKLLAQQARLSFYREEIASARLLQGAVAAAGAAETRDIADRQRLEQEALERFRAVLAIPGHKESLPALELMAHQLAQMDRQSSAATIAYERAIQVLDRRPASPQRNLVLARAKRNLAVLRYPGSPGVACKLLAEASALLTEFGPRRDRDLLELAETLTLEGVARFRRGMVALGPLRLNQAHGHYNDLLRSLEARRKGLFDWMFRTRLYAGHRVKELHRRARLGLAFNEHLIKLTDRYPHTVSINLERGHGVRRRNRKPFPTPKGRC